MKKLLGFIILAALCTTLLIGAAAATFTNPVASGADPYILNDNGTYYLTFSVGGYTQLLYSVHCATSASPLGDFERDYDNIVLIGDDVTKEDPTGAHIYGTAHHTFTQLNDGSWVIVYHAHRTGWTYGEAVDAEGNSTLVYPRVICIDKAYFENVEGGKDILRAGIQSEQTIVFTTKNALGISRK